MTRAHSWDDSLRNLPCLPLSTLTCPAKLSLLEKLSVDHQSTQVCQQLFIYVHLFLPFFFNCLTCAIFLTLEVPREFRLNAISSILGNENSINFQVGFMGPMEGVIAVWVDVLVIAT